MRKQTSEKLNAVLSYPHFRRVGNLTPGAKIQVMTWDEASALCKSRDWKRCLLMTANALCDNVHAVNWSRGQEWNEVAAVLRPQIESWREKADAALAQATKPSVKVWDLRWTPIVGPLLVGIKLWFGV